MAWNRFAYVNNNPIRYNDPSGHCLMLCTAIIGAAVGAIVGAVAYTAVAAATGQDFNTGHMLAAAGGGAVAGALIGSGVAFFGGAAAATSFASGAMGATLNAGANVLVDGLVTKYVKKEKYTLGDASITASASFITSALSYGANGIIKNSIKDPIKQGVVEMGSNTSISVGVNTGQRIVKGEDTTLFDVMFDGIGGMTATGVDWTLSLDPPMSSLSRACMQNLKRGKSRQL